MACGGNIIKAGERWEETERRSLPFSSRLVFYFSLCTLSLFFLWPLGSRSRAAKEIWKREQGGRRKEEGDKNPAWGTFLSLFLFSFQELYLF